MSHLGHYRVCACVLMSRINNYSRAHVQKLSGTSDYYDLGFYPTGATEQGVASGSHLDFLDDPYTLSAVVLFQMEPEGYKGANLALPQMRF